MIEDVDMRAATTVQSRGFTLIELSIAMVIIGLLVGSVLVGQELIRNAQVRAVTAQIEQLETAVNNFRVKYSCLPGDCSAATTYGFNPTILSSAAPIPAAPDSFGFVSNAYAVVLQEVQENPSEQMSIGATPIDSETLQTNIPSWDDSGAWGDAGISGGGMAVGPNSTNDGKFLNPEKAAMMFDQLGQAGLFANSNPTRVYLPVEGGAYWTVQYRNGNGNYMVPVLGTTSFNYSSISAALAYGIDKKRNDGKALLGNVQALTAAGDHIAAGDQGPTACVNGGNYNVAVAGQLCGLEIKAHF